MFPLHLASMCVLWAADGTPINKHSLNDLCGISDVFAESMRCKVEKQGSSTRQMLDSFISLKRFEAQRH